jgi:hypothetical protein
MDFIILIPYIHKLLHILVSATYVPTFDILHLYEVLFPHPLAYNIKDQIICKNLRKITYVMIVYLSFYASPQKTYNYIIFISHSFFIMLIIMDWLDSLDFLNPMTIILQDII